MRRVFVSYAFRDEDQGLATQVGQLLASLNIRATTGKLLGGAALADAVKERIVQADGLIALLTRRDALAQGGWTTHPWVQDELTHARGEGKRTIALVEEGVTPGGMAPHYQYIPFKRSEPLLAFLTLAETVGLWKQEAGRTVKVQILPEKLARQLGPGENNSACYYRFFSEGQFTEPAKVNPIREPGGLFVYPSGVRDEYMIELWVDGPAKWMSGTTPQWMQVSLRRQEAKP